MYICFHVLSVDRFFSGCRTATSFWQNRYKVCSNGGREHCFNEGNEDGLGPIHTHWYGVRLVVTVSLFFPVSFLLSMCDTSIFIWPCCSYVSVERYKAQIFTLKCIQRRYMHESLFNDAINFSLSDWFQCNIFFCYLELHWGISRRRDWKNTNTVCLVSFHNIYLIICLLFLCFCVWAFLWCHYEFCRFLQPI